jgi:hypothetical protein
VDFSLVLFWEKKRGYIESVEEEGEDNMGHGIRNNMKGGAEENAR